MLLVAAGVECRLGVHEKRNNEAIETCHVRRQCLGLCLGRQCALTQNFSKNEDENHADKKTGLLGGSSDASIADDANGEASSETGKADGETSAELDEASVQGQLLLEAVGDEDGNNEAVDTNDTSHDDRNNVW